MLGRQLRNGITGPSYIVAAFKQVIVVFAPLRTSKTVFSELLVTLNCLQMVFLSAMHDLCSTNSLPCVTFSFNLQNYLPIKLMLNDFISAGEMVFQSHKIYQMRNSITIQSGNIFTSILLRMTFMYLTLDATSCIIFVFSSLHAFSYLSHDCGFASECCYICLTE